MRSKHRIALALACAALSTLAVSALAQTGAERFPSRPLRLVVPYPPGAVNDTLARVLAQRLGASLGQTVVVENRAGAGGHLGAEQVARSAPDGYTLVIGTSGLVTIGPHLYRKLAYDPQKDLVPIYRFASVPYAFGVPPSMGLKRVGDLVTLAKARPGALNFASSGNGSVPHLCGELFNLVAGVKMVHVPYKGGAQAINDVSTGAVQLYCGGIATMLGYVRAGRLQWLGVTSAKRSPLLPDEPTMAEQGLPGLQVASWIGVHAPAGMPEALVRRLATEIGQAMASDEVRKLVIAQGAEPESLGPAEFAAAIREESRRWGEIVKASGATVD